jgi:hypothetical protein
MNLRLAASLVVVASLAYACGPRSRTDASANYRVAQQGIALASIGGRSAATTNAREKTVKSGSVTLSARFDVAQADDAVRFEFRVTNATSKSVEVNFPSGQAYDFVVVDSVGREVWRWAEGRIFTQSVQNKLLGKGEGITISEKWAPAKPGRYTAIAELRSTNFPVQEKVEFERK